MKKQNHERLTIKAHLLRCFLRRLLDVHTEVRLRRASVICLASVTFLVNLSAFALTIPEKPVDYIHDTANLLTEDQKISLSLKLKVFEQETSNQIVVATFLSLESESLEDFSIRLAEKWKVGQKGKDNGIILLIFPNDRKLRIEVGYGLESVVPDTYASRIIEEKLKPNFRQKNFYAGIESAIEALMSATAGQYEPQRKVSSSKNIFRFFPIFIFIIILLSFIANFFRALTGGGRTYRGRGSSGMSWGSGSGWGGGSFGGGFSGGGGGGFGGGGSSGSW